MAFPTNNKANEEISKFKLLSSYGGPGSIVHTEYGSIIISCIEEWGFIQKIIQLRQEAIKIEEAEEEYVLKQSKLNELLLSNDERLLLELKDRKKMQNLKYLVLIPDIELDDTFNTIKDSKSVLAINSTFLPKIFFNRNHLYKEYKDWYKEWDDAPTFFPPKQNNDKLQQDNIVLICDRGHISDFPWSRYLKWKTDFPDQGPNAGDLLSLPTCCNNPLITIKDTSANASGFDGKWIRCTNPGCSCAKGASLKGLMSLKINCLGHRPWESPTGEANSYYGDRDARRKMPIGEVCTSKHMQVALTTGNNIYFSRILSSIYMPSELFLDTDNLKVKALNAELIEAMKEKAFLLCEKINNEIKKLEEKIGESKLQSTSTEEDQELIYRFKEFHALANKTENEINIDANLKVVDVTSNLEEEIHPYFAKILRVDNLKITSAQLDFSRIEPVDADSEKDRAKNIFRGKAENVIAYPVVENYGEGIFFAFNNSLLKSHVVDIARFNRLFDKPRTDFASGAVNQARMENWQMYLIHSFCHMIMRELEFRCGYPTASLSERLYSSNNARTNMYGCLIYTAEGAEGSMGGLIAQTRRDNLNNLIRSALVRATVCNSDPLCWQSEGQGLFELNLASCFSCSLISETSCEKRNIYLDRRILIDKQYGFFKDLV